MAADVSIGINVKWDNLKQIEKAKKDLIGLGKTALLAANDFGTTDKEIQKSMAALLPSIKTPTQALKTFTNEGYLAWVNYQKEVDFASKGVVKATNTMVKNLQPGWDKLAKQPGSTVAQMREYMDVMQLAEVELAKVAEANKKVSNTFKVNDFLSVVKKNKEATMAWGSETVALKQAMDDIAKKGRTLEFANTTGKQTENLKALRTEYDALARQLSSTNFSKFNKMLQTQYKYTESTKGSIDALKEKYKALDTVIRSMISSGDTSNLSYYKNQLDEVSISLSRLETLSNKFDKQGFFTSLNKNTEAIEAMDGRLAAVNARMKTLRSTILKVTDANNASEKEIKELRAEYAKLSAEQATLQKQSQKTSVRVSNLLKSFISAQAILWVVRSAFNKVVRGIQEAGKAAADAEETIDLFNVVFEEVSENANQMATNMAAAFGTAKSSIMNGLSTLGDFAEGLGMSSQKALDFASGLSQRMMDVISFKNVSGDTVEVLKTLASALAGNTQNFRTWGYVIKESSVNLWLAQNNMDKLTGTALELAKVQARAALFMEQSTNAAGDMARTFDSTVNITRRLAEANKQLSEDVGVGFNKLATPIKKGFLELIEQWNYATEAKKAYAEIDVNDPTGSSTQKSTDARVGAYLERLTQFSKGNTGFNVAINDITQSLAKSTSYFNPLLRKMYTENIAPQAVVNAGFNFDDFKLIMDKTGLSASELDESLSRLNIEYDKSILLEAQRIEREKELQKAVKAARDSLASFGDDLNYWSSLSGGGIYSSMGANLANQITPLQSALGITPDDATLAEAYQSNLEEIIESASNTLIQAQADLAEAEKTNNIAEIAAYKSLVASAQHAIDEAADQYKDAQAIIDKQAEIAERDKANAESLQTAIDNFDSAMNNVIANITAMSSNISELISDTKISASMLGQDSSIVSIEQQRALALSSASSGNLESRKEFAALRGADLSLYDIALEKGVSMGLPDFDKFVDMVEKQEESIKLTNQFYDRLVENAKNELAYSNAISDINKQTMATFNAQYDLSRESLDAQLKEGKISQKDYDNQVNILAYQKATLISALAVAEQMKEAEESQAISDALMEAYESAKGIADAFDESLKEMIGIKETSVDLGYRPSSLFAGSQATYQSESDALEKSYQALLLSNPEKAEEITSAYQARKTGLSKEYDLNKREEFNQALGLDTAFGQEFFADIVSIFEDGFDMSSLGDATLYLLSQFDSFGDILGFVDSILQELAPLIDSFLAPLLMVLEPIGNILIHTILPVLEFLYPTLQGIALTILLVASAIDTVVVWLGAFAGVLDDIVHFRWWEIGDNFKDAVDETAEIWTEFNDTAQEIVNSTLETASGLSDAQQSYLAVVNDMLGSGLLTGQEALQMASEQLGTQYTGGAYEYIDKDAYNRSYTESNLNIGSVTINAEGKTIQEIIEELEQLNYQRSVTGGRAS